MALASLVPVIVHTAAEVGVEAYHGIQITWDYDVVRLTATGLLLAGLAVFTVYIFRVRTWIIRDDGSLDDRDRHMLASAPAGVVVGYHRSS